MVTGSQTGAPLGTGDESKSTGQQQQKTTDDSTKDSSNDNTRQDQGQQEEDEEEEAAAEEEEEGPSLSVTLLLTSGARHLFHIDARFLRKESISAPNDDPFEMSVYALKELIWGDWHSGMCHHPFPSFQSSIHLLYH